VRNAPTTVQNVVTYDVVIQVGNKDFKLKPGMTANVTVLIARKEGALKAPNSALRFQPSSVKTEGAKDKSKEGPSPPGQQLVERLSRELNLTEEQRSRVESVVKASRQDIQEIREKEKPEETRTRIQSLLRPKIWEFLTEEQRRKFTESSQPTTAEDRRPGRVWVVSPEGKPVPVAIILGITNGTYSEVVSGDLQEGTEVIVEETSGKKSQAQSGAPSLSRGLGR
jgi:HlyD family secretion protein